MPEQNRPSGARIPSEHLSLYYIWSAINANVGITYWDVKKGFVGWGDIWEVLRGLQLSSWIEWENAKIAEAQANKWKK